MAFRRLPTVLRKVYDGVRVTEHEAIVFYRLIRLGSTAQKSSIVEVSEHVVPELFLFVILRRDSVVKRRSSGKGSEHFVRQPTDCSGIRAMQFGPALFKYHDPDLVPS